MFSVVRSLVEWMGGSADLEDDETRHSNEGQSTGASLPL